MTSDWQTIIALAIVAITALLLVRGALRKRRHGGGCGEGACGKAPAVPPFRKNR